MELAEPCTSCNGAVLRGFTREIIATSSAYDLHLLVKPDADLDGSFTAFCTDEMEMIRVNGWACEITDITA